MFEHQGKNGTYSLPNFSYQTLSDDDLRQLRIAILNRYDVHAAKHGPARAKGFANAGQPLKAPPRTLRLAALVDAGECRLSGCQFFA